MANVPTSMTSNDFSGLLPTLTGVAGSLIANNQANQGYNAGASLAKYNPQSSNTTGGNVQGTVGPNGQVSYNAGSAYAPQFAQFGNLATQFGNAAAKGAAAGPLGALPGQTSAAYNAADNSLANSGYAQNNAGNAYLGAGNNVLSAFKQFDPNAYAQSQYQQMAALAAPGQTDQTQQMLNYEQASGRGGVTQNGQLGDVGGLALAQQTANNGLKLAATQNAQNYQSQLGQLASGLSSQGNSLVQGGQNAAISRFSTAQQALQAGQGLNTSNLTNAGAAATSGEGINQQLLNQLQLSMYGSNGQASAGANAGQFLANKGIASANSTGNLFGGLQQGVANQGGAFGALGSLVNGAGNMASGINYNGTYNPSITDQQVSGAGNNLTAGFSPSQITPDNLNFNPDDPGYSFNGAGGQAANFNGLDYSNPDSLAIGGQSPSNFNAASDFGGQPGLTANGAAGDASAGYGIYSGLQQGGVSGDIGAAASAGKLYGSLAGDSSVAGAAGALGAGYGIYSGLKSGTMQGQSQAVLNAGALAAGGAIAGGIIAVPFLMQSLIDGGADKRAEQNAQVQRAMFGSGYKMAQNSSIAAGGSSNPFNPLNPGSGAINSQTATGSFGLQRTNSGQIANEQQTAPILYGPSGQTLTQAQFNQEAAAFAKANGMTWNMSVGN